MTPYQDKIRQEQEAIRYALQAFPEGAGIEEIRSSLTSVPPLRTLQRRLEKLVDDGVIKISGAKRTAKYHLAGIKKSTHARVVNESEVTYTNIPLSQGSREILEVLARPYGQRKRVGYNRQFADAYRPNVDYYLSANERVELAKANDIHDKNIQPAGTYAKQILQRFLLDLSWNSSRLEGNTYSLLDTERLLSLGEQAPEKSVAEAQMILNHKDAIEFMVAGAAEISYNHYTVQNLHALLSNNLLPDPAAPGRLRTHPVGIKKSAYTPTAIPQLIAEMFDLILVKANEITNPHEQAFFIMVQLPYLQPFEDVNKRLSRIAANIALIQHNLIPISFIGVPDNMYIQGLLGVYELNRIDLLKDVFLWACARSADRYARVRQTIGEPDPLRVKYREELQSLISEIVTGNSSAVEASGIIKNYALQLPPVDQRRFIEMIETELLSLHEGNFARYRVRPSEFKIWKEHWLKKKWHESN
jgi:DNA-binding Lrp family transcriptional regulator